jgi:hypothetical protein
MPSRLSRVSRYLRACHAHKLTTSLTGDSDFLTQCLGVLRVHLSWIFKLVTSTGLLSSPSSLSSRALEDAYACAAEIVIWFAYVYLCTDCIHVGGRKCQRTKLGQHCTV